MTDVINPTHYRNPQGVQLIEIIRHLPFSLGNALKYAYRCKQKDGMTQDINKAKWYLDDYVSNPMPCVMPSDRAVNKLLEGVPHYEAMSVRLLLLVGSSLGTPAWDETVEVADLWLTTAISS